MQKHIITINPQKEVNQTPCGECQTSCQSACKTSCTVGNQICEK
ncbi:six-cysteine ranthipeptide SCIFF [Proteinivorax hydrogeniformans]|uniref:Six-cysteine ranthipeptide SCIFF n=1 Tax=Proteinivorax hydrogeniformans TaxID=1826727 RepID=A0AAU8HS68_9FIRM